MKYYLLHRCEKTLRVIVNVEGHKPPSPITELILTVLWSRDKLNNLPLIEELTLESELQSVEGDHSLKTEQTHRTNIDNRRIRTRKTAREVGLELFTNAGRPKSLLLVLSCSNWSTVVCIRKLQVRTELLVHCTR